MIYYSKYRDFFIISAVYFVTFFAILLNNGLFWDGWVINNSSNDQLIQMFKDNGNYWYGYVFSLIKSTGTLVSLSRLITFIAYLIVGIFFYRVLSRYTHLLSSYALILTLYFITFPVNFARITIMNVPYAICLVLFAIAYFMILKNNKSYVEVFISSIFLFLSLFMASLVFLVPVIVAHKFVFYRYSFNFNNVRSFLFSNKMLFVVPIAYVVVKLMYLEPGGMYDNNYNQITFGRVMAMPLRFLEGIYGSIVLPINLSFSYAVSNLSLVLLILYILNKLQIFNELVFKSTFLLSNNLKKILIFSIVFLFLGMVAYILVGKTPSLTNWNSRHQILLPVGASFLLFSAISFVLIKINNVFIKKQLLLLPIAIFIIFNVNIYFSYIIDWYKQESFIENVMNSNELMSSSTFIIVDNTKNLNALNRSKGFMGYTGIFKQKFGKEDKLADENPMLDLPEYLKYKKDKVYGISDWAPSHPEYIVYLNYGSFTIDNLRAFKMIFNQLSNSNKNLNRIKNILSFEIKNIGSHND
tara:strand:- start:766 stop:2343 length:1578 start_codon:yes stop_codon:yes gene_type:complete